ncbi:MAG: type II toxin-antitoxin system ParD family antitoxin [Methylorubrum populi]
MAKPEAIKRKRYETLRAALIEGEESGPPEPFDTDSFLREKRAGSVRG